MPASPQVSALHGTRQHEPSSLGAEFESVWLPAGPSGLWQRQGRSQRAARAPATNLRRAPVGALLVSRSARGDRYGASGSRPRGFTPIGPTVVFSSLHAAWVDQRFLPASDAAWHATSGAITLEAETVSS